MNYIIGLPDSRKIYLAKQLIKEIKKALNLIILIKT